MEDRQPERYHAYLLRLWRVADEAEAWRASLEDPHSGEQRHFADLSLLFRFLQAQTQTISRAQPSDPGDSA